MLRLLHSFRLASVQRLLVLQFHGDGLLRGRSLDHVPLSVGLVFRHVNLLFFCLTRSSSFLGVTHSLLRYVNSVFTNIPIMLHYFFA